MVTSLIRKELREAVKGKLFPGCVVGVVYKVGKRLVIPYGNFTYAKTSPKVKEDTIYDTASITKIIPTSCLAMKLVEEDKIGLEDKLIKYVPEFRNKYREKVLIKHLISQGLDCNIKLSGYKDKAFNKILDAIYYVEFNSPPGAKHFSTNTASILLGLVLNRSTGKSLEDLGRKYFFKPMGMERTTFDTNRFKKKDIVPTEIDKWRGRVIQGEVHDEITFALSKGMHTGASGLFSTVPDLLNFMEMLINKGKYKKKVILQSGIIGKIKKNQFPNGKEKFGLGWDIGVSRYMGRYCGASTIGKTGYTGCCCIGDIKKGVALVILSNYHYPRRKDFDKRDKFFCKISNLVIK